MIGLLRLGGDCVALAEGIRTEANQGTLRQVSQGLRYALKPEGNGVGRR